MAGIGWDETSPQDNESAGLGDDRIRSLKTSLRQGLDDEHFWPSGGGDAGKHRPGSARAYYGPQSAVSSTGTDGRLMYATDTGRLFHVGSLGTSFVGGQQGLSIGQFPGATPQRHIWVEEFGQARLPSGSNTSISVSYNGSNYSGIPYIFLTQNELANDASPTFSPTLWAVNINVSSFVILSAGQLGGSGSTIAWRSVGTRVL